MGDRPGSEDHNVSILVRIKGIKLCSKQVRLLDIYYCACLPLQRDGNWQVRKVHDNGNKTHEDTKNIAVVVQNKLPTQSSHGAIYEKTI
jgi:hypothetical protein